MNSFRTEVSVSPSLHPINPHHKVLTTGSCFADAIGARLQRYKFPCLVNPFGVVYNPLSIHKTLHYAVRHEPPPEHTYLQHQQVNLNYDFHSALSALEQPALKADLMNRIGTVHYFLKDAALLFITYGTAFTYSRNDTGEVVANCHKMPASAFTKSLVSESAIVESFGAFYDMLMQLNPSLRIILTLSPVRHIKDSLVLNSVSKAVLRMACHRIAEKFTAVEYFPAYEIMMDDLRDYRFYASDMLHPTEDAEEYIWEKFGGRYFSADTQLFLKQWQSVLSALAHKPFHVSTAAHQQFLKDTLKKLEALSGKVDVSAEMAQVRMQILKPSS